jgi:hypothetical protein
MNIITRLGRIYTQYKYKRDKLNIIQQIPTTQFQQIVQKYQQDGWEMSSEYHAADKWLDHWQCKLRKGTSTLICEWTTVTKGEISGPQRVIIGLGKEFILTVKSAPSWH